MRIHTGNSSTQEDMAEGWLHSEINQREREREREREKEERGEHG
jgi:hypothetical protein